MPPSNCFVQELEDPCATEFLFPCRFLQSMMKAVIELPFNTKTPFLSITIQSIFSKLLSTFYGSFLSLLQFINTLPKLGSQTANSFPIAAAIG